MMFTTGLRLIATLNVFFQLHVLSPKYVNICEGGLVHQPYCLLFYTIVAGCVGML